MSSITKPNKLQKTGEFSEIIGDRWLKNRLATLLFLSLSLNLIIAPAVMAATGASITRQTAYAIGILYCVTVALSVYLFAVIFQPERF
ncbi:MAG: potassium-transporting ATPase subunit F [Pleurocapsa sp. MO_226.B13]|nr:potassium-transporting ATPase subunit F [Pleurocapsa sp. MO_226.B13]